jgi:TPR repeat protein
MSDLSPHLQRGRARAVLSASDRGGYATAIRLFRPLAENGDVIAQYYLGDLYDKAKGVPQDYTEATKWYRRSAEQGFSIAQHSQERQSHHVDSGFTIARGERILAVGPDAAIAAHRVVDTSSRSQRMTRSSKYWSYMSVSPERFYRDLGNCCIE